MKTNELTGPALDWAVIFAQCLAVYNSRVVLARDLANKALRDGMESPSTDWSQAGPIIEREHIRLNQYRDNLTFWEADIVANRLSPFFRGPTPLIAAMRCYVASKLGDEIDIPEELK